MGIRADTWLSAHRASRSGWRISPGRSLPTLARSAHHEYSTCALLLLQSPSSQLARVHRPGTLDIFSRENSFSQPPPGGGGGEAQSPSAAGQVVTGPLRLPLCPPLPALLWAGLWAALCRWQHRSLGFGLHQCDLGTCFPTSRLWLVVFILLFSSFL